MMASSPGLRSLNSATSAPPYSDNPGRIEPLFSPILHLERTIARFARYRMAQSEGCVTRSLSDRESTTITRSEEHTSELQSRLHLVCRLLLEKKKKRRPDLVSLHPDAIA